VADSHTVVTDDDTGWTAVLLETWGPRVRDAVVTRVERACVGRRGVLVRTVAAPDDARFAWTEQLHELVLGAIRDEVGADLEALGSQAAWACYDEVWTQLAVRWHDGGALVRVPADVEVHVRRLVAGLSLAGAEAAAADVSVVPPVPLELDGRVLVDVDGLRAHLASTPVDRRERAIVEALLGLVT
jgi:hypothetical protein